MRVCIQFDETKPHWALNAGFDKVAESLGMRNVTVTGDFDSKLTYIYGDIDVPLDAFKALVENSKLREGSVHRVARPKPKYWLEVDTGGVEASGYEDRLPWVSYGTITAEGDTLEECLENAQVDLIDQDGGERGLVEADSQWMQDALIEEFWEQQGFKREPNETIGDFQARCERLKMKHGQGLSIVQRGDK